MLAVKKTIMLLLKASIPVCATLLFLYTVRSYYQTETGFFKNGYYLFAILYGVLDTLFLHMYGGTKIDTEKRRNLILSDSISLIFTNIIIYIIISLMALRFFNPTALAISMFVQIVGCGLLYFPLVFFVRLIYPPHNTVAIITGSENELDATEKVRLHDNLHRLAEILSPNEVDDCFSQLEKYHTVMIGDVPKEMRAALLTYCYTSGKEIIIIPSMQDILLNNSEKYIVNDKLLYTDKYIGFSAESAFIKRCFDILFALTAIILTSPIMAVFAICIRLYDKGPALFRQKRLTYNGREFTIVKFRSMIVDAEQHGDTYLVMNGDSRITPIGKFIRATRIDELPQLFNILKGDMSFVGPRPERPELYEIYCKTCPEFRYRLKVKAGLTGYAQVYGKYNTTAEDKVKLDLLYIERASIIQDLQIFMYTIKIIFVKDSSEGIVDKKKAARK